jgi:hypothetical protein
VVVADFVMFNILELIMEIVPNYPTVRARYGLTPPLRFGPSLPATGPASFRR